MAFHINFVKSGLLLVIITIVVQSIPIDKNKQIVQSPIKQLETHLDSQDTSSTTVSQSSSTTSTTTTTTTIKDQKKKRFINDNQFDGFLDNDSDEVDESFYNKIVHPIHSKMHETPVQIHDNADKPVDTDDSKIYSDIKMSPNELTNIVRRRRDVKLNDHSNRRRKRALLPYDFYNTDSFYDPYADLIEQEEYDRPARSFAPLYWYPSVYERDIRSILSPSFYEPSEYPIFHSASEDIETPNLDSLFNDENDDENDYELNRYPILLPSSNNPFDNLQLQQQYNTDDLPIDEESEDDDDEQAFRSFYQNGYPYYTSYGPFETYL